MVCVRCSTSYTVQSATIIGTSLQVDKQLANVALSRLEACFKQGNPARNGKKNF